MYPQRYTVFDAFDFIPPIDVSYFYDNPGWLIGFGTVVLGVVAWELLVYYKRRRRERIFGKMLKERIAAREMAQTNGSEELSFSPDLDDVDLGELSETCSLLSTWESSQLAPDEEDHMRERSAHHAREWLTREISLGNIHPLTQSHVYNLLYSLKNAETKITAFRESENLHATNTQKIADGRPKPRYKLIIQKD